MLVEQIMTKKVVSVELDDSLSVVKQIFDHANFHHLLVVEKKTLYGVISDRDLFKAISPKIGTPNATVQDEATLNKKVHQIMSRELVCLPPAADVYEAIRVFNQHQISCIPIVDKNKHPLGILSWRDILRVIEINHNKKLRS